MEFTSQPLSKRTAEKPRFCTSIPQARPVGPAPMMATSHCSLGYSCFDLLIDTFERCRQSAHILACTLRHVGTAAPFPSDAFSNFAYQLAGRDAIGEVLGDGGDDGHARVIH